MKNLVLGFVHGDRAFRQALIASASALVFKVAGAVFSFLLGLMIARKFGAQGSGIFALATTIATMGSMLSLFGFDYSSTQAVAAHEARGEWSDLRSWIKTATAISLITSCGVAAILWLSSDRVAAMLGGSVALSYSIAYYGLAIVPMTLSKVLSAYLRGMHKPNLSNFILSFLIPAVAVLLFVWPPPSDIEGAIVRYTIAACVCAFVGLAFWLCTMGEVEMAESEFVIGAALRKSMPTYLTIVGAAATGWIITLTVGAARTESDVGIFRVAGQIATVLNLVPEAVAIGIAPQFAALYATGSLHAIAKASRRMTALVLLVVGVPAMVIYIFADYVLAIFGPEFVGGASTLRIMTVGVVVKLMFGPVGSVLVMTDLQLLSLLNTLAGSAVALAAGMSLVPRYGVNGGAVATILTDVFRLIVATGLVWHFRSLFLPLGLTRSTT